MKIRYLIHFKNRTVFRLVFSSAEVFVLWLHVQHSSLTKLIISEDDLVRIQNKIETKKKKKTTKDLNRRGFATQLLLWGQTRSGRGVGAVEIFPQSEVEVRGRNHKSEMCFFLDCSVVYPATESF